MTAFRGYVSSAADETALGARSLDCFVLVVPDLAVAQDFNSSCADVDAAVIFYRDVLGMRLSDRSGADIAFMHGIHRSDHHMVAFARSDHPGLHHTSWDVASLHEVGLGAMQMADKGFCKGSGLGRHVLGSNYFHYVQDPWGSYSEYSCDMDLIPAGVDWQAGDFGGEDAFYVWGSTPPDDFTTNKERVGT